MDPQQPKPQRTSNRDVTTAGCLWGRGGGGGGDADKRRSFGSTYMLDDRVVRLRHSQEDLLEFFCRYHHFAEVSSEIYRVRISSWIVRVVRPLLVWLPQRDPTPTPARPPH